MTLGYIEMKIHATIYIIGARKDFDLFASSHIQSFWLTMKDYHINTLEMSQVRPNIRLRISNKQYFQAYILIQDVSLILTVCAK